MFILKAAGLLGVANGFFFAHLYVAAQTDTGLIVAAVITSGATIVAGVCSVVNTWILTRVRRRQESIHRTAEEGAQSLIGMAYDAARHEGIARRSADRPSSRSADRPSSGADETNRRDG